MKDLRHSVFLALKLIVRYYFVWFPKDVMNDLITVFPLCQLVIFLKLVSAKFVKKVEKYYVLEGFVKNHHLASSKTR